MGQYKRRVRAGIVLYHDDLMYLRELPDDEVAIIMRFLAASSIALSDGNAAPPTPSLSGISAIVCKNMMEKLERDHAKYLETCEKRGSRNGQGDLSKHKSTQGDLSEHKLTQGDLSEHKSTQGDFDALTKLNETENKLNLSSPLPPSQGDDENDDLRRIQQEHDQLLDAAKCAGLPATDAVANRLIDLYSEHGLDKLLAAIDCCVEHSAVNLAYLRAVLQGKPKPNDDAPGDWMDELRRRGIGG